MNESELFPELSGVLTRATDGIEPAEQPHHAASAAWARARVVRNRRRGLAAVAVAAVTVLAIAVVSGTQSLDRSNPPIAPSPTVPAIPASAVQATFDPDAALELPQRESNLPATLDPPADASVLPLPTAASLVLRDPDDAIFLLGTDGTWARTKAPSGSAHHSVLSDDGTQLANLGEEGLFVTDVRDGTWRELELPNGPEDSWTNFAVMLRWQGNERLALASPGAGLARIEVSGGLAPSVDPSVTMIMGLAPVSDGSLILFGRDREGAVISELVDGQESGSVDATALPDLQVPVASEARVVGIVNGIPQQDRPTEHSGVLVLEREGYAASAYLPIAGTRYTPGISIGFQAGDVSPIGWLDEQTVLLAHVRSTGRPWSLVAWDVESGALTLVSRGGPDTQPASVARDLVAD